MIILAEGCRRRSEILQKMAKDLANTNYTIIKDLSENKVDLQNI